MNSRQAAGVVVSQSPPDRALVGSLVILGISNGVVPIPTTRPTYIAPEPYTRQQGPPTTYLPGPTPYPYQPPEQPIPTYEPPPTTEPPPNAIEPTATIEPPPPTT